MLKESQRARRPDAGVTLRKLFWSGCPGGILPIDCKTFITCKSRPSCLSTGPCSSLLAVASTSPGRGGRRTVRSGLGLRLPGLPRHSQSEQDPEQPSMPQGTPAKAERLGSRARVISPGRQEPSLPAPPTLSQHAVCRAARRRGGQTPTAQERGSLVTQSVHGLLLRTVS